MILDSFVNVGKHSPDGTTIGILAREHKDVEQMLLETIEINAFLVEDGSVVDISQFIRLDSIGHNAVANLCLLAIHTEIQSF